MKILQFFTRTFVALAVLASATSHSAVSMKVVQGTSCAPASAPIPITAGGGAVTLSVCVVATASEAVCAAGFPILASNAAAVAAGVSATTRTNTAPLTVTQDVTALPVVITGTATQFGNSVVGTGVQPGGTGANIKVAELVFTVPAGLPAATTFNYAIDGSGEIGLRDATKTDCNDLTGTLNSQPPGAASFSLVTPAAATPAAPTVNPLANATLTGGTGPVPVTVANAGVATGSLGLACSIPAGTAAFAVTAGGTRTINAPATLGANAPAIGLSCTPQATVQTALLTCVQTATPLPSPANLTATITCPAVVVAISTVTAATAPGAVTLPTYSIGSTPSSSSTTLNFSTSGAASSLTCTAAGAGYSVAPSPLALTVGTVGSVTVTYTGTAIGTFAGLLTCTPAAPTTGGSFAYTLSTTVQAAQAIGPAVQVPTMGNLGLALMGLLIAGFAGLQQRRRAK